MNPKIAKMRTTLKKNEERIETLTIRNEKLRKQITELENIDIIGMVREQNMTPEQLAVLIGCVPSNTDTDTHDEDDEELEEEDSLDE